MHHSPWLLQLLLSLGARASEGYTPDGPPLLLTEAGPHAPEFHEWRKEAVLKRCATAHSGEISDDDTGSASSRS